LIKFLTFVIDLDAKATPHDVKAFGLATHRGTFVTWNKQTGEPFHNLVRAFQFYFKSIKLT